MDLKGVIFDLDGVIVSTDKYHYLGWKKIADRENIYFDETINNRLRGVSRMESLDIILERAEKAYTQDEKLLLAEDKNKYYVELLSQMDESHILPGVMGVLNTLRQRGIKIAIGSSSKNTKYILGQIGLQSFFDAIADGNDITKSKPDPEVFLVAAERLQLSPDVCAVVEDAVAGIDAANAAGMVSIGISDAKSYEKAAYTFDKIDELLDILN